MKPALIALSMALAGLLSGCASLGSASDAKALQMAQNKREYLSSHAGSMLAHAEGLSNFPVVKPGDIMVIRAKPFADVTQGDLIAFIPYGHPELFVTHFADARRWDGWITKGANNSTYDRNRVNPGNYVGVAEVIRLN